MAGLVGVGTHHSMSELGHCTAASCISAVSINTNHDSQQQMYSQTLFYHENEKKNLWYNDFMPRHPGDKCDCDDVGNHKDHIRKIGIA